MWLALLAAHIACWLPHTSATTCTAACLQCHSQPLTYEDIEAVDPDFFKNLK